MDNLTDILFSAPLDSQSSDTLLLTGLMFEEIEEDAPGVKLGKRALSEEQDFTQEPPQKKAKPYTVDEQDDVGPREPPALVLPGVDPGAGQQAFYDDIHLELLYNKLEIIIGRYNPSFIDARIFFGISPGNPEQSSLPAGTFAVFIILEPPFPYERISHRLRALEYIDTELNRVLRRPSWKPQKMIYYILDEEHTETSDPAGKHPGRYWAEARKPLGGPQGFDYGSAFARIKKCFPMVPSRRLKNNSQPDWAQIRFETDKKLILGGHTNKGKDMQRFSPLEISSAQKHCAGRTASRKPKQDSLLKKVATKQAQSF